LPTKKSVLLTLTAFYAAAGFAMGLAATTAKAARGFEFVLTVVTMVCVYVWCRVDAQSTSKPVGRWPLWVALFTPVALPLYFFRTRTKRRALISTGKAVAFYVGITLLFFALAVFVSAFRAA
jgi:hypothetical protein